MKILAVALLACGLLAVGSPAQAADPREVDWEDLVPELAPYDDPFEDLTPEQLYLLADYAEYQQARQDRGSLPEEALADMREARLELEDQGVDVDGLLSRRAEVTARRMERAFAINQELDGREVRMPGYMLPLEFRDRDVVEFLLVPYVGACIHVPPPPPNQIVHVTHKSGFPTTDLFTPVWIEGELVAQHAEHELFLADGTDDIPVAYTLDARHIELYEFEQ